MNCANALPFFDIDDDINWNDVRKSPAIKARFFTCFTAGYDRKLGFNNRNFPSNDPCCRHRLRARATFKTLAQLKAVSLRRRRLGNSISD